MQKNLFLNPIKYVVPNTYPEELVITRNNWDTKIDEIKQKIKIVPIQKELFDLLQQQQQISFNNTNSQTRITNTGIFMTKWNKLRNVNRKKASG